MSLKAAVTEKPSTATHPVAYLQVSYTVRGWVGLVRRSVVGVAKPYHRT